MIRLSHTIAAVIILAIGVTACSPTQQAALQAPAVYATVVDPNVPLQDKACTVLGWGIPIAREREATYTPNQRLLVQAAAQAGSAYCAGKDLSWQHRALAAADEMSKVIWGVIR